jgi:catechol 2,3-dioxygenase-like lactoylglutathione lyase family enzyme
MTRLVIVAALATLVAAVTPPHASAQSAASTAVRASRLILRVSDLDRSTAFYRDRVGLKLQSINEEFAVFDAGGMVLMLEHLPKPPSSPSGGLAAFTEIVLESADVLATHAAMRARGVQFTREPRVVTSDDTRVMYATDFRDPDGHVLSIAGWVARRAAAK